MCWEWMLRISTVDQMNFSFNIPFPKELMSVRPKPHSSCNIMHCLSWYYVTHMLEKHGTLNLVFNHIVCAEQKTCRLCSSESMSSIFNPENAEYNVKIYTNSRPGLCYPLLGKETLVTSTYGNIESPFIRNFLSKM